MWVDNNVHTRSTRLHKVAHKKCLWCGNCCRCIIWIPVYTGYRRSTPVRTLRHTFVPTGCSMGELVPFAILVFLDRLASTDRVPGLQSLIWSALPSISNDFIGICIYCAWCQIHFWFIQCDKVVQCLNFAAWAPFLRKRGGGYTYAYIYIYIYVYL